MGKKSRRGFTGSIGFRVLSISLIFLAIPLIIYSMVLYEVDYRHYMRNLYEDVGIMGEEEISWLHDKQVYYENALILIEEFVETFNLVDSNARDTDLTKILQRFIADERISAIVYCDITPDGRVIATKGTLSSYIGVDFSKDLSLAEIKNKKNHVVIAIDPIIGHSMYVVRYVKRKGDEGSVVMSIISLDMLLAKMQSYQKEPRLAVSIVDSMGVVIGTTAKEYEGKIFSLKEGDENIVLKKVSYDSSGRHFTFEGVKHFADIRQIPKSSTFLILSIPQNIVMSNFRVLLYRLAIFLFVVIVVGLVVTYIFTKRIARPMHQLGDVMTAIGSGDLDKSYEKDRFGFEINALGDAFNQMRDNLKKYIEEVKKEKGMKEAFEKELQIGHEIQRAILPAEKPEFAGVDIATYYSPAKEVAGDYYDYLVVDEDRLMITVADGVGKGISSCLYSFDLRSIMRTAALEKRPLDELIMRSNTIFCKDTKESCNFVTLVSGYLNKKEKTFQFTNAGHLPVMVKRANKDKIDQYSTKGIALGIEEITSIETESIPLNEGDFCVLYTDGVTEAMGEDGSLYTPERLLASITSYSGNSSEEMMNKIMDDLQGFVGNKEQFDDISLVVFKI